jgi:predicted ATPase
MDRIKSLTMKNVRAFEHAQLELCHPITVLIGENGGGKSTILECLEVLRKAADPNFMTQFYAQHRGLPGLLRKGATTMELGVLISDDAGGLPDVQYTFALEQRLAGAVVSYERMSVNPLNPNEKPTILLSRTMETASIHDASAGKLMPIQPPWNLAANLVLSAFGSLPPLSEFTRVLQVLRGIEVHLPFDTLAAWAARAYQFSRSSRLSTMLLPADRLDLLGFNLANAWSELKNQPNAVWEKARALVKLGIGEHIDTVIVRPDPGGSQVALALSVEGLTEPILASDLSDGQLAWLSFVALSHLNPTRSLLAIDEPETHLHPSLLGRVVDLLANLEGGAPVILSTHSDRVLELVENPANAIRVCRLQRNRAELLNLDPQQLPEWLASFGDMGQLRAAGYLSRVLATPSEQDGAVEVP